MTAPIVRRAGSPADADGPAVMGSGLPPDRDGRKSTTSRWLHVLGGLLLLAIGALPSLLIGFPLAESGARDQDVALRWLSGFSRALADGVLWPRWLIDDQFGFGSPAFFFYPPLAYLVASILSFLPGMNADMAIRLGMALFAAIGFGLAWRLVHLLGGGRQAPLLAGLYVATPWPAFVDQIARGAFAEYATIAVLPLVGMVLLVPPARTPMRIVATGVAYALLILTHLPVAVLAAAVGLLYLLLTRDPARIGCFLAGMLLAGALAAPLLIPAMTMQGQISARFWKLAGAGAASELLFGGHNYGRAMTVLKYACFAVFSLTLVMLKPWRASGRTLPAIMLGLCLLGTTILTWPAWKYLPLLPLVQLPVRLFAVIPLFWIAALAVQGGIGPGWRRIVVNLLPAAMTLVLTSGVLAAFTTHRDIEFHVLPSDQRVQYALRQPLLNAPEYLPAGADREGRTRIVVGTPMLDRSGWPQDLPRVIDGAGSVIETRTANGFTLHVDCPARCRVLSRQFWFPGWRASGGSLHADPATGLILIDPDVAHGVVTVVRVHTWQELAGFAMSLAAIVACVVMTGISLHPRSRVGQPDAGPQRVV